MTWKEKIVDHWLKNAYFWYPDPSMISQFSKKKRSLVTSTRTPQESTGVWTTSRLLSNINKCIAAKVQLQNWPLLSPPLDCRKNPHRLLQNRNSNPSRSVRAAKLIDSTTKINGGRRLLRTHSRIWDSRMKSVAGCPFLPPGPLISSWRKL